MGGSVVRKAAGICAAGGMVFALAGCGGGARSPDNSFTMAFGNLLAYNTTNPPAAAPLGSDVAVECPAVNVQEGQSAYRAMAGAEVRYQFSLGDLARECRADTGTIAIRVGVSGYLLSGQSGASGTFSVPVRIDVRSQADQRIVASRVIRVAASLAPGESQATFAVVADPLTVPFLRPEADQDYEIFVGLDPKGAAAEKKPARRRRG